MTVSNITVVGKMKLLDRMTNKIIKKQVWLVKNLLCFG